MTQCNGDCNQGRECNCKCKMTDLDELRVALKSGEYDGTHIMRAWLLVDKVKELETDLDDRKREVNLRCGQIQERDIRIAELTTKLDKAREALKWIDKVNAMDSEYVRVARQALVELDK